MERKTFETLARKIDEIDNAGIYALEQTKNMRHKKDEYYPYIPQHRTDDLWRVFFEASMYFNGDEKVSLLDVGCGTGRILKLAKEYGIKEVCGVEFHKPYVEIGKKIHGLSNKELIVADAFTLDGKFLEKFNVIYTYMPIRDRSLMSNLNLHLIKNASRRTIFIEMQADYYPVNNFRGNNRGQVLGNYEFVSYCTPY